MAACSCVKQVFLARCRRPGRDSGNGVCDVMDGEPEHQDVYLADEEKASNEQIVLCCSRVKSQKLVLDI